MEGRNLDLTIISAEDLKKVNLIGRMHTYAVAWVDPYLRQQTVVDKDGGAKPYWNQKLAFPVPERFFQQPNSNLTVEIFSKGLISGDKFVGSTVIPLSELAQKMSRDEVVSATYQVKQKSGKVKGSLRLAGRVGEKTTIAAAAPMPAAMPVAAYANDNQYAEALPYGYPPAGAPPYGYPPAGAPPYGYPPRAQYPQAYDQGYGGQGYYPQAGAPPQYYGAQPSSQQGMGGMGMGLGTGLLAGAVGGLVVGDIVNDAFDGGGDF